MIAFFGGGLYAYRVFTGNPVPEEGRRFFQEIDLSSGPHAARL